jgi:hypothetical protein
MTTHILAITYQPKIEGVKNGTIRQTIRPLSKIPRKVGDKLILHGWKGKPYRSPWSWRLNTEIELSAGMLAQDATFKLEYPGGWETFGWVDESADWLARDDGIVPPTGLQLKQVLETYHGKFTDKPVQMQVIRW